MARTAGKQLAVAGLPEKQKRESFPLLGAGQKITERRNVFAVRMK
jgi:hypothetical protein